MAVSAVLSIRVVEREPPPFGTLQPTSNLPLADNDQREERPLSGAMVWLKPIVLYRSPNGATLWRYLASDSVPSPIRGALSRLESSPMKKNPGEISSTSRTRIAATVVATYWLATIGVVEAQSLRWGTFNALTPFGSGSTATLQTQVATVVGSDRGSGPISITLGIAGDTSSWNGFGVGTNDDRYFPAPNQPQPGITMVTGAPGYNGGIPAVSQVSFATRGLWQRVQHPRIGCRERNWGLWHR